MGKTSRIILCYKTVDPDDIDKAHRYWEMDEAGRFVHKATEYGFSEAARSAASAHDLSRRHTCGHPAAIHSRSEMKSAIYRELCEECLHEKLEQAKREAGDKAAALASKVSDFVVWHEDNAIDYTELPYAAIFVLALLNKVSGEKLEADYTFSGNMRDLTPMGSLKSVVDLLYEAGAIYPIPKDGISEGFLLNPEGNISWFIHKVDYDLVPHANGSLNDAMTIVKNRLHAVSDTDGIYELWRELCVEECWQYLQFELVKYGLEFQWDNDEAVEKIREAFLAALLEFSTAQVWSSIWKCVKDVAALSQRTYFNNAKAMKTLPGKIEANLAKARKREFSLKEWTRPTSIPPSEMALMFDKVFGLTEKVNLTEARQKINLLAQEHADQAVEYDKDEQIEMIQGMLDLAFDASSSAEAVFHYGELILDGYTTKGAVERVVQLLQQKMEKTG